MNRVLRQMKASLSEMSPGYFSMVMATGSLSLASCVACSGSGGLLPERSGNATGSNGKTRLTAVKTQSGSVG